MLIEWRKNLSPSIVGTLLRPQDGVCGESLNTLIMPFSYHLLETWSHFLSVHFTVISSLSSWSYFQKKILCPCMGGWGMPPFLFFFFFFNTVLALIQIYHCWWFIQHPFLGPTQFLYPSKHNSFSLRSLFQHRTVYFWKGFSSLGGGSWLD